MRRAEVASLGIPWPEPSGSAIVWLTIRFELQTLETALITAIRSAAGEAR